MTGVCRARPATRRSLSPAARAEIRQLAGPARSHRAASSSAAAPGAAARPRRRRICGSS
ncbi:MAG: hypothetical protein MZW92_74325 [Comamonadaceae bacterium]|nr:hypothetical protein [Comamonadaceae bacterium]